MGNQIIQDWSSKLDNIRHAILRIKSRILVMVLCYGSRKILVPVVGWIADKTPSLNQD